MAILIVIGVLKIFVDGLFTVKNEHYNNGITVNLHYEDDTVKSYDVLDLTVNVQQGLLNMAVDTKFNKPISNISLSNIKFIEVIK